VSGPYPPFRGPRIAIARALADGGGPVAGRIAEGVPVALADASGTVELDATDRPVRPGDLVSGRLTALAGGRHALRDTVVHAGRRAPSPDGALTARLPALAARARATRAARAWFDAQGFLEIDTPARVPNPGLEPHLRAFPADATGNRWLITSPELHLKRVLAAGAERVVEFARAFRDDERGPWHRPEFTLIEWYRAWEGLDALERDCEALVAAVAAALAPDAPPRPRGCDPAAPFARTTVREQLRERTGIDPAAFADRRRFAEAVEARGHRVASDDDWDAIFFRLWIAEVEPYLGRERPVFVHGYPASQAALARVGRDADGFAVAERFELYVAGVEIANAFDELIDPDEQRRRHEADRAARVAAGVPAHPPDERFLAALAAGMPPAAGIALGLDRLIAVLLGADGLRDVVAFSDDED